MAITAFFAILVGWQQPAFASTVGYGCFHDGGYDVNVCIYQYGTATSESPGVEHVQITSYAFVVTNLDPHTVVLGSTTFRFAVFGRCLSGCSGYRSGAVVDKTLTPRSGTRYTYTPPWHNATTVTDKDGYDWQAGDATVTYYVHTHKITYNSDSVCQGYLGNGTFSTCG